MLLDAAYPGQVTVVTYVDACETPVALLGRIYL